MSAPKRIQRRRTTGWRMPEGAVYVGRPSRWGNPFRIYGASLAGPSWQMARVVWTHIPAYWCDHLYVTSSPAQTAANAVAQFRTLLHVRQEQEPERLRYWLYPLIGRDLACWCPTDQPCHADVLLEYANGGAS